MSCPLRLRMRGFRCAATLSLPLDLIENVLVVADAQLVRSYWSLFLS